MKTEALHRVREVLLAADELALSLQQLQERLAMEDGPPPRSVIHAAVRERPDLFVVLDAGTPPWCGSAFTAEQRSAYDRACASFASSAGVRVALAPEHVERDPGRPDRHLRASVLSICALANPPHTVVAARDEALLEAEQISQKIAELLG